MQEGETADLLLVPQSAVDGLLKAGKVQPGSDFSLARSSVGVAVRKGAPKPDISTPEALKANACRRQVHQLLQSGLRWSKRSSLRQGAERLGIAEEMKAKTKHPPEGGLAARLLAAGEAEIAVQQIGELISVEGVDLLGPLPGDLQSVTTYAAAIPSAVQQPEFRESADQVPSVTQSRGRHEGQRVRPDSGLTLIPWLFDERPNL